MRLSNFIRTFIFAALVVIAAGHGVIIAATGNVGGEGTALGVNLTLPRNGTVRNPFQQDTTRFKHGENTGCGSTLLSGQLNITSTLSVVIEQSRGLPKVTECGFLNMTLHQVNSDGAGPYECMLDVTGTGKNFTSLPVSTQVPGKNGRNKKGQMTDWPLVVELPFDLKCTGSSGDLTGICLVRCQNPVGPFGGCVPVQQVDTVIKPLKPIPERPGHSIIVKARGRPRSKRSG